MKKILIALTMGVALTAAQANIFYNETFSYPDGALTSVSGGNWTAQSGAGAKAVMVSSGQITLQQSSGSGEDLNRSTGSSMGAGDTWYAGFDVTVNGTAPMSAVYFASFLQGTSFYDSRVFVTAPAGSGDFAFGLSGAGSAPAATWADGTFGVTYRLVASYNYDTMECRLWVAPTDQNSTFLVDTATHQDAISAFALRQASPSTGTSSQVMDNLVVANDFTEALTGVAVVPEPGTISLSLLGGLALLGLKLRRSRA